MKGSCATLDRSSICTGFLRAENKEGTSAAALERSAAAAVDNTVTFEALKFWSSTTPPGKLLESRVLKGWHGSRLARLEKVGKTDGLPGARADPELLAVSRSL